MKYFVHPKAICESLTIGEGTSIWAFAHILPGASIGRECNICDGVFIENRVVVGDRVTVKCGVQLWDGVTLEDEVFIGPNATFTNDRFPRSKQRPAVPVKTLVRRGASVGANATVLPGVTIGQNAMVGAGSVVTRSVPPNAIVAGNPACIVGYIDSANKAAAIALTPEAPEAAGPQVQDVGVNGVALYTFLHVSDLRGDLTAGEFEKEIPFVPKRYFLVYDVTSEETRGQHAHRTCHQLLVCVKGRCAIVVDDGVNRREIALRSPVSGLYLPPLIWGVQYKFSPDAVLLVFASDYYDPGDYIRDYEEFLRELNSGPDG